MILDLSSADTSGFDAIDAGSYNASVYEATMEETSGSGKLPAGVPMVNVQFAITDGQYEGRRLFNRFALPTAEQHEKASLMQGNFVKFLVAVGEDEKKLKTKGFDPEQLEDIAGRECVVRVSKEKFKRNPSDSDEEAEWTNNVKAIKPAGSPIGSSSPSPDLL